MTIIVVKDAGDKLVRNIYTGVDQLLAAYGTDEHPVDTVTLKNVAVYTTASQATNRTASVIFAYDGAYTVEGGIVFFPKDITPSNWNVVADDYYQYNGVYLNGAKDATYFRVAKTAIDTNSELAVAKGFYRYVLDAETKLVVSMEPVALQNSVTDKSGLTEADGDIRLKGTPISDTCTVVDVRNIPADEKVDSVNSLTLLLKSDYTDNNKWDLELVYFVQSNKVVTIYVVDANTYTVSARVDTINSLPANADDQYTITTDPTVEVWNGNNVATFSLTRDSGAFTYKYYDVTYWDGTSSHVALGTVSTVDGKEVITFSFKVNADTSIDIMNVDNGTDTLTK